MKRIVIVLVLGLIGYAAQSQSIDYNVQEGYAAAGYDVVAYFDNQALRGSKKFMLTHEGLKYKFSSQANLETFKSNPNQYLPQYGGYCAYAIGTKGEKVNINPKTFEIRDDKLYLFYNAWGTNTLKLWLGEDPPALVKKADANWANLNKN